MKRFIYCLYCSSFALLCQFPTSSAASTDGLLKLSKKLTEQKVESPVDADNSNDEEKSNGNEILNFTESDLWNRIRHGYAIPNLDNHLVTYQTNWYSSRIDYLLRIIQRGSRYLYHVVDALDKRGMPTDLALLPFIESAFNPNAISTAKASGMWQFMPATGRDFNLRQNIFKDDRRGVLDSTEAALDYLQRLYNMFGDWQLALAAYNWGEGSVQRAIKRQQAMGLPIDFDSLSALMPNETKNYVPKLQAVKNIIGHPEQFNVVLPRLDNEPYFTSVKNEKDIDVHLAAKLAELPLSEFKALNPQFNRPVITGGGNTSILLPIENASVYESNFMSWKGAYSSWTTLSVNKSERVESLANRFGYKPDVVREVNAIPAKMVVKAGSTILVPKTAKSPETDIPQEIAEDAQLRIERVVPNTRKLVIKAGKKDSLASIAKRHKLSIADIKAWNDLSRDQIKPGQKLVLHLASQSSKQASKQRTNKLNAKSDTKLANNKIKVQNKRSKIKKSGVTTSSNKTVLAANKKAKKQS
ncbi:transglycosylase SLT domain-containing protein [Undibacterium baiyunense]|uniref:Transglycosylase SLT domain-containing protein n=1 Tax=Undibacterium baiyunense TaxID=2828731 RepID=A0A941I343_9BURK|nr:transglycosylase SLT domain-containing protein [Undibacterium baiyunense]MBR7746540.1 transglycosylase SLT domain-containing protein [Undibacterium baiyunense]